MSDIQKHTRFTAARTSREVLGYGWRDAADRIAGIDRGLASEVMRLGGGLDQVERDLLSRIECVQHCIDGTGPCEGCRGWGASGNPYLATVTTEISQLAADRDAVLREFTTALGQVQALLQEPGAVDIGATRPTIRFGA